MRHISKILVLLPLGSDTVRNFRLRTPSHKKCFAVTISACVRKELNSNVFLVYWQFVFQLLKLSSNSFQQIVSKYRSQINFISTDYSQILQILLKCVSE